MALHALYLIPPPPKHNNEYLQLILSLKGKTELYEEAIMALQQEEHYVSIYTPIDIFTIYNPIYGIWVITSEVNLPVLLYDWKGIQTFILNSVFLKGIVVITLKNNLDSLMPDQDYVIYRCDPETGDEHCWAATEKAVSSLKTKASRRQTAKQQQARQRLHAEMEPLSYVPPGISSIFPRGGYGYQNALKEYESLMKK